MGAIQSNINQTIGIGTQIANVGRIVKEQRLGREAQEKAAAEQKATQEKAIQTQKEAIELQKQRAMDSLLERVSVHTGHQKGYALYQLRAETNKLLKQPDVSKGAREKLIREYSLAEREIGTKEEDFANLLGAIATGAPYAPPAIIPADEDEDKDFANPEDN